MDIRDEILGFLRECFPEMSSMVAENVWVHSHTKGEDRVHDWVVSSVGHGLAGIIYQGSSDISIIDALRKVFIKYSRCATSLNLEGSYINKNIERFIDCTLSGNKWSARIEGDC